MERLLTLDQIEALIGRKVTTLRTDIRQGRLAVTRLGRGVRVSESNLKRFLAGQNHDRTKAASKRPARRTNKTTATPRI